MWQDCGHEFCVHFLAHPQHPVMITGKIISVAYFYELRALAAYVLISGIWHVT